MSDAALASSKLAQIIRDGIQEEPIQAQNHGLWSRLREVGTEGWLDTGDMEQAADLWSAEFTALTTNNTLLNKEIQKGLYDQWIPQAAAAVKQDRPDISEQDLVLEIAFGLNARHGLRLVQRFGAYVSVELHTDLAHDVERSLAYGRRYHALEPDRFIVKVPLTPEGLLAARRMEEEGIKVNFTLGFSARQNYLIACVAKPHWCNVFMGRLNAYVADQGLGNGAWVGERATLASQAGVRSLREKLGVPTRQIGASMRSGEQVHTLAGLDVYTMPVPVAQSFLEAGLSPEQLRDQTGADYRPEWAEGVQEEAEGLTGLWDLNPSLRETCESLANLPSGFDAAGLVDRLAAAGHGYLFPALKAEEVEAIRSFGKVPERTRWQADLASGRVGLDALFTLAGLHAFAQDQAALDDRIRRFL
ncbi:MAG: transaldolase [Planctomycetota bacterium]|nr:MAG: transaldolase [Planctomycetota bacterium]